MQQFEHQGHRDRGFLKRAEESSTERANKARWLMNSRNSLTNPITSDKLKCQRLPYVASHFLCCYAISPATDMSQQHMAVCRTVWGGFEDGGTVTGDPGRCLSLSIDRARRPDDCCSLWRRQAGRQAGLPAPPSFLHPLCFWKESFRNLDMTYCHVAPVDKGIRFLGTCMILLSPISCPYARSCQSDPHVGWKYISTKCSCSMLFFL